MPDKSHALQALGGARVCLDALEQVITTQWRAAEARSEMLLDEARVACARCAELTDRVAELEAENERLRACLGRFAGERRPRQRARQT